VTQIQRSVLRSIAAGGTAFWLPSLVLHAIVACGDYSAVARLSTIILPIATCATFALLVNRVALRPAGLAASMLAGVWLFGSSAMMISATLCGGGARQGTAIAVGTFLLGLLPPYTFIMATYDGALGGLMLITGILSLAWVPFEIVRSLRRKQRPTVPPNDAYLDSSGQMNR
jgi:hypothetical protein